MKLLPRNAFGRLNAYVRRYIILPAWYASHEIEIKGGIGLLDNLCSGSALVGVLDACQYKAQPREAVVTYPSYQEHGVVFDPLVSLLTQVANRGV